MQAEAGTSIRWRTRRAVRSGLGMLLLCVASQAHPDAFCFLYASNYYEQVYCELKALGKGARLPALFEFRNNDEITQALLLKRPAQSAGIELEMPQREPMIRSVPPAAAVPERGEPAAPAEAPGPGTKMPAASPAAHPFAACTLAARNIRCDNQVFSFAANRRNSALPDAVFSPRNRMGLDPFAGDLADTAEVEAYLDRNYPLYLRKMIDLGLAEATMTYGKFAAIFYDVTGKGLSFSERLETMYRYLKKDKQSIGVNVSEAVPSGLTLDHCEPLAHQLVRCVFKGHNILFVGEG